MPPNATAIRPVGAPRPDLRRRRPMRRRRAPMSTSCALLLMAAVGGSERVMSASAFVQHRPATPRGYANQRRRRRDVGTDLNQLQMRRAFVVSHHATKTTHVLSSSRRDENGEGWSKAVQKAVGTLDRRLDIQEDKQQRRRNMSNGKNGSVQFISPLLEDGFPPTVIEFEDRRNRRPKPLLLYLPGFDGTVLAPFLQFPSLGEEFDVRAMRVEMDDRSTFEELKDSVVEYLLRECRDTDGVVYLMGESFGGILATEVALELHRPAYRENVELRGLILVNPATCFLRSSLYERGPSVATARPLLPILESIQYVVGLTQLVPLFLDQGLALRQLVTILSSKGLPSVVNSPQREAYMGRVAFDLPKRLKFMPKDTLKWRLEEWLEWGCGVFEDRLQMLQSARDSSDGTGDADAYSLLKLSQELRTLIVVGEHDLTLPSYDEAQRLSSQVFRNAHVHVVPGAGHASTCGGSLHLMRLMRQVFPETDVYGSDVESGDNNWAAEELHGLEPRYDGASIGLNPLLYWSSDYYLKWRRT